MNRTKTQTQTRRPHRKRGVDMMSALLFSGGFITFMGGSMGVYDVIMLRENKTDARRTATMTSEAVRTLSKQHNNFSGMSDDRLIMTGAIPRDFVMVNGEEEVIAIPYGGVMSLLPETASRENFSVRVSFTQPTRKSRIMCEFLTTGKPTRTEIVTTPVSVEVPAPAEPTAPISGTQADGDEGQMITTPAAPVTPTPAEPVSPVVETPPVAQTPAPAPVPVVTQPATGNGNAGNGNSGNNGNGKGNGKGNAGTTTTDPDWHPSDGRNENACKENGNNANNGNGKGNGKGSQGNGNGGEKVCGVDRPDTTPTPTPTPPAPEPEPPVSGELPDAGEGSTPTPPVSEPTPEPEPVAPVEEPETTAPEPETPISGEAPAGGAGSGSAESVISDLMDGPMGLNYQIVSASCAPGETQQSFVVRYFH